MRRSPFIPPTKNQRERGQGPPQSLQQLESHKTWCIDSGPSDEGYGVQLVIVWDGDIPPAEPQEIVQPKTPVKRVQVTVSSQKKKIAVVEDQEEEMMMAEVVDVVRE